MDYSPFNLVIWLIFAAFVVITYLAVKVFHRKYPNYPQSIENEDMQPQTEKISLIENSD